MNTAAIKKILLKDCHDIYSLTHSLQAVEFHLNMCVFQGLIGPIVAGRIFNKFKDEYLKEEKYYEMVI